MYQVTEPVFCDALRVSVPDQDADTVMSEVSPCLDAIGAHIDYQGSYRLGTGLFSRRSTRGVCVFNASGQVLAALRAADLLGQYLMAFSGSPHTVTRLDATAEVSSYAPDVIRRVYGKGHREQVTLSRKVVPRKHLSQYLGPVLYEDPSERVTGSVYFGGPQAEVRAVVYDKRQEMLAKQGVDIGEDRVRFECRIKSGMSPSLKDAYEPGPIFHHFMSPCLIHRPDGCLVWVPAGSRFHVERGEVLPYQRMKSIIEGSPDFGRVVDIADSLGDVGVAMAMRLIERRFHAAARLAS